MIPQSITEACVKAFYGSNDDTTYGKIQAVLMAYESMRKPTDSGAGRDGSLTKELNTDGIQ